MEVRDFTSGPKVALEASVRQQANHKAPKTAGKEVSTAPVQKADKVELSTKGGGVVIEKSGAIEKEQASQTKQPQKEVVQAASSDKVDNTPLRRDYDVENGNLVVKFVDTHDNKVVKEIPAEESRRIKEAISKFRANEPTHQQPASADAKADGEGPKEIDVTS